MSFVKWWISDIQDYSLIDWRRLGKDVWIMISKYLNYHEKLAIWKYFGLEMPTLHIMYRANLCVRTRLKMLEAECKSFIDMCEFTPNEARRIFLENSPTMEEGANTLVAKFVQETHVENGGLYFGEDCYGYISEIVKAYKTCRVLVQCFKCKKFNRIRSVVTKNYTGDNGYSFPVLREMYPGGHFISKDYLCPCWTVKKENVKVTMLDQTYLEIMLRDFFHLVWEKA